MDGYSSSIPPTLGKDQIISAKNNLDALINSEKREKRRGVSMQDIVRRYEFGINQQKKINTELQATIDEQDSIIENNSQTSKILVAVSITVSSIISGSGALIYGQTSPESLAQSSISDLMKNFSDEKTGYMIIAEAKETNKQISELTKKIGQIEKENKNQAKIIELYKELDVINAQRLANAESIKKDTP